MKKVSHGFTLVEVLVALMILSAGILLLVQSWSGSMIMVQKTKINVEIAALLERKMAEIEIEYRGKSLESIPEEKEDDFGSDFPNYKWKMESREFTLPDLSVMLTSGGDGGAALPLIQILQQFSEHLSKAVKEVKATVIYTGYKKPIQGSVTTFFIDYDKPLPIPGAAGGSTNNNTSPNGGGTNTNNGNSRTGGGFPGP